MKKTCGNCSEWGFIGSANPKWGACMEDQTGEIVTMKDFAARLRHQDADATDCPCWKERDHGHQDSG
jgi:hypothetical protein